MFGHNYILRIINILNYLLPGIINALVLGHNVDCLFLISSNHYQSLFICLGHYRLGHHVDAADILINDTYNEKISDIGSYNSYYIK